jgi:hypothetical protein
MPEESATWLLVVVCLAVAIGAAYALVALLRGGR